MWPNGVGALIERDDEEVLFERDDEEVTRQDCGYEFRNDAVAVCDFQGSMAPKRTRRASTGASSFSSSSTHFDYQLDVSSENVGDDYAELMREILKDISENEHNGIPLTPDFSKGLGEDLRGPYCQLFMVFVEGVRFHSVDDPLSPREQLEQFTNSQ
ncbi:hypothetical protein OROGR_015849 [Orobanche gracilis]